MGRPALPPDARQARSITFRLDSEYYEKLQDLVARARTQAGPMGEASITSVLRGLIGLAHGQGEAPRDRPPPPGARAPAPRTAPPTSPVPDADQDAVDAALTRLGGSAPAALADAAALVTASGVGIRRATAALWALAEAGKVELRPAGEASRRPADFEPNYPRNAAGFVIGTVARLGAPKASAPQASAHKGKPKPARTPAPASFTDEQLRAAVRRAGDAKLATRVALREATEIPKGTFDSWLTGNRNLPPAARTALVKELARLGVL